MRNARLDESQTGIKIDGENINNLRYEDGIINGRKWRRTKQPFDKGERREWKCWFKLIIQKTKIMASSPITSWHIDEEKEETVVISPSPFCSKIIADSDCSHEIKRCSLEEKLWPI